jgi:Family of unknown function (DUF6166)
MVKCTRCGRSLKKAFIVNGQPYGPVCVRKVFGLATLLELTGKKTRVKKPAVPEGDPEQGVFFGVSDTHFGDAVSGPKTYIGHISCPGLPDEEYHISVETGDGKAGSFYPLSLKRSLAVVNHSPTGFCWGYGGSGPAQTALAIMLDFFAGDTARALQNYQDFKFKFVAGWDMNGSWRLTSQEIESWLSAQDVKRSLQS